MSDIIHGVEWGEDEGIGVRCDESKGVESGENMIGMVKEKERGPT